MAHALVHQRKVCRDHEFLVVGVVHGLVVELALRVVNEPSGAGSVQQPLHGWNRELRWQWHHQFVDVRAEVGRRGLVLIQIVDHPVGDDIRHCGSFQRAATSWGTVALLLGQGLQGGCREGGGGGQTRTAVRVAIGFRSGGGGGGGRFCLDDRDGEGIKPGDRRSSIGV
ncbi:hypothetical protein D1007_20999 [Hordeum vulgare]|nr:hypothetical protein D1007_20999 [Hordeum vulgare]